MVLAAGTAFASPRMVAQDAPAGTAATSTVQSSEPAKSDAAKPEPSEEEQQSNAFRLEGPVVKWVSNTTHLSLEITARIFEFLNFAVVVLAIGVPLYRFLPKYLVQRREKVQSDIESARKVTEDANARLSAVEAKLSKLDEEIARFRSEVEQESLADEARIKASLEEESVRVVQAAEQEITSAAAQARRGLRNFAADLAIDQAARQLTLTAETDRALIAEFVGDVKRNGTGMGGNS